MLALDRRAALDHLLDRLLGNILAHAVVDAPSGENDLWVIAQLVGFMRQIVRIDADAVAANQPRTERKEIPLRSSRLENLRCIDADLVEEQCELVHQRDI